MTIRCDILSCRMCKLERQRAMRHGQCELLECPVCGGPKRPTGTPANGARGGGTADPGGIFASLGITVLKTVGSLSSHSGESFGPGGVQ